VVVASVIVSSCRAMKVAYNNADRILFRYMDEYLDLTAAQTQFLKPELQIRLDEHRREELPRFITLLDRIVEYANDGLNERETHIVLDMIVDLYAASTHKTAVVVVPVLAELDDRQILHLERKLEQANRQYHAKYLVSSGDQRKAKWTRQTVVRIEQWTGPLSDRQISLVTRLGARFPDTYEDWYVYRKQQQQRVISMVRRQASSDELEDFLTDWWVERANISPQLRDKVQSMWAAIQEMVMKVDGTVTDDQRRRALRRVNSVNRQLRALVN